MTEQSQIVSLSTCTNVTETQRLLVHGVKIADNALVAAAMLSHRYITDRFLPDKAIDLLDEGELGEGYGNLRGAYLAVMKKHFAFNGKMPDKLFFTAPQYNTWIELGVEQFQDRIIKYAESIVENGFTPGVLMIDGGFCKAYQPETGIAGYTLVYHSRGFELVQLTPFTSTEEAILNGTDIAGTINIVEIVAQREKVRDTDIGRGIMVKIADLERLLYAYRKGVIKERP